MLLIDWSTLQAILKHKKAKNEVGECFLNKWGEDKYTTRAL